MAEGRMLKRAVSESRRLSLLKNDTYRMLWTWALPHLDVMGRMTADPILFKSKVAPRLKHITVSVIEDALQDMAQHEVITVYEVDGDRYLEFRNFHKYNKVRSDREGDSLIPAPGVLPECSIDNESDGKSSPGERPPKLSEDKLSEDKGSAGENQDLIDQVIAYLNLKTGKNYSSTNKENRQHVNARIKDGFSLEELYAVIDFKVKQWEHDPKMREFLRPITLFSTKFENYLQQAKGCTEKELSILDQI